MATPSQGVPPLADRSGHQHVDGAQQYGSQWGSHDPQSVRPHDGAHNMPSQQPSWGDGALDQQLWYDQSGLAWAGPAPYSPFQPQFAPQSPETALAQPQQLAAAPTAAAFSPILQPDFNAVARAHAAELAQVKAEAETAAVRAELERVRLQSQIQLLEAQQQQQQQRIQLSQNSSAVTGPCAPPSTPQLHPNGSSSRSAAGDEFPQASALLSVAPPIATVSSARPAEIGSILASSMGASPAGHHDLNR